MPRGSDVNLRWSRSCMHDSRVSVKLRAIALLQTMHPIIKDTSAIDLYASYFILRIKAMAKSYVQAGFG